MPKRGIFPMSSLLLIKSWELWDRRLKQKKVFNIADIYMNLHHSRLGIENLEMIINIYKNWLKDARVGGSLSMK
jgi:hypothetical protein